jgi:hypothetical protein
LTTPEVRAAVRETEDAVRAGELTPDQAATQILRTLH